MHRCWHIAGQLQKPMNYINGARFQTTESVFFKFSKAELTHATTQQMILKDETFHEDSTMKIRQALESDKQFYEQHKTSEDLEQVIEKWASNAKDTSLTDRIMKRSVQISRLNLGNPKTFRCSIAVQTKPQIEVSGVGSKKREASKIALTKLLKRLKREYGDYENKTTGAELLREGLTENEKDSVLKKASGAKWQSLALLEELTCEEQVLENPYNELVEWVSKKKDPFLMEALSSKSMKTSELTNAIPQAFRCSILVNTKPKIITEGIAARKTHAYKIALTRLLAELARVEEMKVSMKPEREFQSDANVHTLEKISKAEEIKASIKPESDFQSDANVRTQEIISEAEEVKVSMKPESDFQFDANARKQEMISKAEEIKASIKPESDFQSDANVRKQEIISEAEEIKASIKPERDFQSDANVRKQEIISEAEEIKASIEDFQADANVRKQEMISEATETKSPRSSQSDVKLENFEVDNGTFNLSIDRMTQMRIMKNIEDFNHNLRLSIDEVLEDKDNKTNESGGIICPMTGVYKTHEFEHVNPVEEETRNLDLLRSLNTRENVPVFPANMYKNEILEALQNHRMILITGPTGCGKSTQVPQMLFDEWCREVRGTECNIIVSEPRRITVTNMYQRVCEERQCEVGDTVGYRMYRSQKMLQKKGGIMFYTAGTLREVLRYDRTIEDVNCIIVDEIHETSVDNQFLLSSVMDAMKTRPDLKIILMSASAHVDSIKKQYGMPDDAVIEMEGRTYPIMMYFAPDTFKSLGVPTKGNYSIDDDGSFDKIRSLVMTIDKQKPSGSILVFLSGWRAIKMLYDMLKSDDKEDRLQILLAHSGMSEKELQKIYDEPIEGKRKVILSTNICETGVTIPDVVYVVDSGVEKLFCYDTENNCGMFRLQRISKTSAEQRAGRVGRTQPGEVYRIYSKRTYRKFQAQSDPEIDVGFISDELCKSMSYGELTKSEQLGKFPSAVDDHSIELGLQGLQRIGLITTSGDGPPQQTPLGRMCTQFGGVTLSEAKGILMSAFLGCAPTMMRSVNVNDSSMRTLETPVSGKDFFEMKKKQNVQNDILAVLSIVSQRMKSPEKYSKLRDELVYDVEDIPKSTGKLLRVLLPKSFAEIFGDWDDPGSESCHDTLLWHTAMASIVGNLVVSSCSKRRQSYQLVSHRGSSPIMIHSTSVLRDSKKLQATEKTSKLISCVPLLSEDPSRVKLKASDCTVIDPLAAALFSGSKLVRKDKNQLYLPDFGLTFNTDSRYTSDMILSLRETFSYCMNSVLSLSEKEKFDENPSVECEELLKYTKSLVDDIVELLLPREEKNTRKKLQMIDIQPFF